MIGSPLGPGFFIFFQAESPPKGPSNKTKVFASGALKWKATRKLKRKLAYYRKQEIDELITPEVVEKVTEDMVRDVDLRPTVQTYQIDPAEAQRRLEAYIQEYVQRIQDDEAALLLIFANI